MVGAGNGELWGMMNDGEEADNNRSYVLPVWERETMRANQWAESSIKESGPAFNAFSREGESK